MKQAGLKFKMHMQNVSIINNNAERFALNSILAIFAGLTLLYILFLGNMVVNIIERRHLEANASELSDQVQALELAYFDMSAKIDLPLSQAMGFKETKITYATRRATLGSIKTALNEI